MRPGKEGAASNQHEVETKSALTIGRSSEGVVVV